MGEGATLDSGDLAGVVLDAREPDRHPDDHLARAVASARASAATARCVRSASVDELRVRSLDERPLPLQVDGDYIGEATEAVFGVDAGRDRGRRLSAVGAGTYRRSAVRCTSRARL